MVVFMVRVMYRVRVRLKLIPMVRITSRLRVIPNGVPITIVTCWVILMVWARVWGSGKG